MRLSQMMMLAVLVGSSPVRGAEVPDFALTIRPLLVKHCYSCHGPDKQKGDLRLDRRADAFKGGESGPAVVVGKSVESLIVKRISTKDSERMPPKGDGLKPDEIASIQAWIDAGAKWPDTLAGTNVDPADWWSLKPLHRPALPSLTAEDAANVRTPVDAFILAKIREQKLTPAKEADRRTLIRRVSFDLTGLPPSADEIDAFVNDPDPKAYQKLVNRLLDSPHYGERWARHWLDVVHYGDTHGYDKDQPRPNAYPYRDYVIRAFNNDKPYTRFVQEQIAGDGLFPNTVDGFEALGFIAAGPWDLIGHIEVPESKIDGKIARHLDRDDMVSNTLGSFMSLTVHCAQCHNHKFDPISQEDYYRLQAVFAAVDRADQRYDREPAIAQKRQQLQRQLQPLLAAQTASEAEWRRKLGPELVELETKIAAVKAAKTEPQRPEYGYHSGIAREVNSTKWVQIDLGEARAFESISLTGCFDNFNSIGAGFGFPQRFKVEASDDPSFQNGVAVLTDQTANDYPNPGTTPKTFTAKHKARYLRVTATKLALRQNDYIMALAELEVTDSTGKNLARGAKVSALDSIEALPRWGRQNLVDGIRYRVGNEAALEELQKKRTSLLAKHTTPEEQKAQQMRTQQITALNQQIAALPPQQTAFVGAIHKGYGNFIGTGNSDGKPRPIHLLARGNVQKPGKLVEPGVLRLPNFNSTFTLPAEHKEVDRRVALAQWITDPKNPLTWRSFVNRVWQYHMGRALVETPNDFGRMGQFPSHPELLDWLAVEFRDGQSIKALHRLIVNSATYRQESSVTDEQAKLDANNMYYSHMNRRRLEAEAIRDSILVVAGKLDRTPYGPAFRDFVVEKPEHSPHYQYHLHDADDPKTHRRSIYRFIVRSQLQPFLTTLDCADPSLFVEKRNQTISPLQALTMLNNQLCVVMAKHFANRVEKQAKEIDGQITTTYRFALGRTPNADEHAAMKSYTQKHGLTNLCRLLLNVNEFVFVD